MENQLTFNGHDLSEILYIQSFNKGVQLGRHGDYDTRKNDKGADYVGYTSEVVSFTSDFLFKPGVKNKKEKLAQILNVTEPKVLLNSSEPGIYYLAMPMSSIESDETSIFGDGRIVWEIPAGVSYSVRDYIFSNVGDGQRYVTVTNPGTEPMELNMKTTFTTDSGFIGLSGPMTNILLGDMAEVDGEDYEKSVMLFDDAMYKDRGWVLNDGVIPPVTKSPKQAGSVQYKYDGTSRTEGYAHPSYYGPVVSDWSGPSLTKIVPADSTGKYAQNWRAEFRLDFNTDGGSDPGEQVGHQSITFSDDTGGVIVSIVIEDNYGWIERSDLAVYVANKRVFDSRGTDRYYFTARPGKGNHFMVERIDGKVKISFVKHRNKKERVYLEFPFEDDAPIRKITWWAARYKGHAPMTNNLLRAFRFTKHGVWGFKNMPNKFMKGDVLEYGQEGRNIFCRVNDQNQLRLRDIGSTKLLAPPGNSLIRITNSGFANVPEITLTGKARYVI